MSAETAFSVLEAMSRFVDLLEADLGLAVGPQQERAAREFARLALDHGLVVRRPGEPWRIAMRGPWYLVGLGASYSLPDLRLLDAVVCCDRGAELIRGRRIAVFDVGWYSSPRDLEADLPGIRWAWQTPVVGIWTDGILTAQGGGYAGRALLDERLGTGMEFFQPARPPSRVPEFEEGPGRA